MKKKICTLLVLGVCLLSISACASKAVTGDTGNAADSPKTEEPAARVDTEKIKDNIEAEIEESIPEELTESDSVEAEPQQADTNKGSVEGMRPEFKEAMDSYEAFYDEYCDIMKKYSENPTDLKLLADYANVMAKAAEMTEKFDAWENNDLNDAELKYYLDVTNRVTKKLVEVSEYMQ